MSDTAIKVEGLSKRYLVGHHRVRSEKYTALRDVVARNARSVVRKTHALLSGKAIIQGDDVEEFWALRGVDFEIKQGERVGIIGRNGAGKSTLLKILSRITEPTDGRASIRGRVASLLEVGTGFHPELSGRENIFLNGAILGMTRNEIQNKFDEIVAFAEVDKFLDTPVKRYSSGMYVRLAFAVAAHLEPEILIVDEVLAVGDAGFQKKCVSKMSEVAQDGRTVLFVSHNMGAVRNLCDKALFLKDGRICHQGLIDDVVSTYMSDFSTQVRQEVDLLGCSPDAELDVQPTRVRFYGIDRRPTAMFAIGESWRVAFEFRIRRPLRSVVAAIGVATIDGIPVVNYWSASSDLDVGSYVVEFIVEESFRSRDFLISVALSSMGNSLYFRENCAMVSVCDISQGEQPFRATGASLLTGSFGAKIEPMVN